MGTWRERLAYQAEKADNHIYAQCTVRAARDSRHTWRSTWIHTMRVLHAWHGCRTVTRTTETKTGAFERIHSPAMRCSEESRAKEIAYGWVHTHDLICVACVCRSSEVLGTAQIRWPSQNCLVASHQHNSIHTSKHLQISRHRSKQHRAPLVFKSKQPRPPLTPTEMPMLARRRSVSHHCTETAQMCLTFQHRTHTP